MRLRAVSVRHLATHTSQVLREAQASGEPIVVTNSGTPVGIFLPIDSTVIDKAVMDHLRVRLKEEFGS